MRISRDEWGLRLAETTALRGTCLRRQVGCVLVDRNGRVLSTGYNGPASGLPNCNDQGEGSIAIPSVVNYPNACPGARYPSGTGLDECFAVHAECNSLLQCHSVRSIETCYVTVSPCVSCVKMLMNTSCRRVVFREAYTQSAEALWSKTGGEWLHLEG